jgi:hypothetical protein
LEFLSSRSVFFFLWQLKELYKTNDFGLFKSNCAIHIWFLYVSNSHTRYKSFSGGIELNPNCKILTTTHKKSSSLN